MAGTLPPVQALPPDDLETGMAGFDSAYNQAILQLNQLGLPVPQVPPFAAPEIPGNLSAYNDEQLGDMLNQFSIWASFVDYRLAEIDAALTAETAKFEFICSRIRVTLPDKLEGRKLTTQDKNDRIGIDPRVHAVDKKIVYLKAMYGITRTLRDKFQKSWETVSRRITQRGQEVERIKRDHNVAGAPAMARSFRTP